MPLIKRATDDLLVCTKFVDIMVNPVNCIGVAGKGLALAFKEYCPEQYESYRSFCIEGKLRIGTFHIYYNEKDNTTIINLPTKRHWVDDSNLEDVELSIVTLANYLKDYPFHTVALPMLGAGNGRLNPLDVYQLFEKHLDALPNIIFVCIRPISFKKIPNYLVIGGSRKYNNYMRIELGIMDAMCSFGVAYHDFEAMVSGGAKGVDAIACGTSLNDIDPNIADAHKIKRVICQADWNRYQKAAGFIRNKTVLEIGTHFVLYIGSRSVGTRSMKGLIDRHNAQATELIHNQWKLDHGDKLIDDVDFNAYNEMLPPTLQLKQVYIHDISQESE